jgi:acetylornithine/N-succinyldiaminopimelate aminotransferase
MLGLRCARPNTDLVAAAREAGLLVVPAADNVIRLLPALNIPDADLAEAVTRLEHAAAALETA